VTFTETKLHGVYVVDPQRSEDERGFFARTWCEREFAACGLNPRLAQCSVSYNRRKGTVRGLHYQAAPHQEAKLVRCTRGAIYDVVLDLRPASASFRQWAAMELTASNYRMLYVPEGCAHGFQTLKDESEVLYQISEFYAPEFARGVRWDDPAFAIEWHPGGEPIMSQRDRQWPLWDADKAV
jgi:dTDP-4-dehydrorhamnose 3,5-epimerase